ncbi:MAG: hypothetical protein ACPG4W_01095 [Flavobacteriales bacterium]
MVVFWLMMKLEIKTKHNTHKEDRFYPLFLALCCFAFSTFLKAQNPVAQAVFNLDTEKLGMLIQDFEAEKQAHIWSKSDFIHVLFNATAFSDSIQDVLKHRADLFSDSKQLSKQHQDLYLGELELMHSLLIGRSGSPLQASQYLISAYKHIKNVLKTNPKHQEALLLKSYMDLSLSYLPNSMKWVLSVLGLDTDKETALDIIRTLHKTGLNSSFARYELDAVNLYFQLQFDLQIIKQDTFNTTEARLLVISLLQSKKKQIPEMIQTLQQMDSGLILASFLMGKALFLTENSKAKFYFEHFLENNQTEINQTSALYYLYQIAILESNKTAQSRYYTLISSIDEPISYRDKWAKANYKQVLSPAFIQIRNAFDRADFDNCLTLITKHKTSPNSSFLAYYACKSLAHLGKFTEAKSTFNTLLTISSKSNYYPPKAALFLAKTYAKNKTEALYYLDAIEDFDDYLYQDDIENQIDHLRKAIEKND